MPKHNVVSLVKKHATQLVGIEVEHKLRVECQPNSVSREGDAHRADRLRRGKEELLQYLGMEGIALGQAENPSADDARGRLDLSVIRCAPGIRLVVGV